MNIVTEIKDPTILKAVDLFNAHCLDSEFIDLLEKETFTFKYKSFDSMRKNNKTYYAKYYRTINPFSNVIGHFSNDIVYINKWKKLSLEDRIQNLWHEIAGHGNGFTHLGNRPTKENLESVPYKGSRLFVKYLKDTGKL